MVGGEARMERLRIRSVVLRDRDEELESSVWMKAKLVHTFKNPELKVRIEGFRSMGNQVR